MKLFNELKADVDGRVRTIHVDNANTILVGRRGDRALGVHPNPPEGQFRHRVEEEFINAIRGIEPVTQNTFEIGVRSGNRTHRAPTGVPEPPPTIANGSGQ